MWTTRTRSTVIGGGAAILIALAGTAGGFAAAHAADSTPSTTASTPSASPSDASAGKDTGRKHGRGDVVAQLKGLQHAQWVVAGKDGAFVTHDAIRGTVTAVSATSLTVKAKDGVSATYAVGTSTKVVLRTAKSTSSTGGTTSTPTTGKAAGATKGSIADVNSGAEVLVSGTGTSSLSAERILVPRG